MNWMDPTRKVLAGASVALSICFASYARAEAPCRPYNQLPPGYRQMGPSGGQYYGPNYGPAAPSQGQQGVPTPASPDMTSPSDMGQQPQAQDQAQQQQQQEFTPSPESSSRASLAPGANTPQLGRMDQANRLNLFDNMSAAPQNKVWFGMQYATGINTGLSQLGLSSPTPAVAGFTNRQKQIIYRAGGEVMLDCCASVAVQGQYFTNETEDGPLGGFGDDFSNPQVLFKYVLARDCDTILSATLGVTIETDVDQGDFEEDTTKIYPGMLYYETLSGSLFTQGGFQFGIPTESDQITTFDWSVSLGYWLYRDCSLDQGCCCCNSGRITGLIPQVNLLGKHVVGDGFRENAFGLYSVNSLLGPNPLVYNEPDDVIDLSVGGLILIGCNIQVGVGYSFPITNDETRENEFLSYVNYLF